MKSLDIPVSFSAPTLVDIPLHDVATRPRIKIPTTPTNTKPIKSSRSGYESDGSANYITPVSSAGKFNLMLPINRFDGLGSPKDSDTNSISDLVVESNRTNTSDALHQSNSTTNRVSSELLSTPRMKRSDSPKRGMKFFHF